MEKEPGDDYFIGKDLYKVEIKYKRGILTSYKIVWARFYRISRIGNDNNMDGNVKNLLLGIISSIIATIMIAIFIWLWGHDIVIWFNALTQN